MRSALIIAPARRPCGGGRRRPARSGRRRCPPPTRRGRRWRPVGSAGDGSCRRRARPSPSAPARAPASASTPARRGEARGHDQGRPRDHLAGGQPDAGEPVAGHLERRYLARRPSGRRGRPAARARSVGRLRRRCAGRTSTSSLSCRHSSAWCTAHRSGRQDADRLVAHLPAVAVRAVQDVAAPTARPRPGRSGSSSTRPVATSSRRAAHLPPVRRGSPGTPSSSRRARRRPRPLTTSPP